MQFNFNGTLYALSYALDCVEHDLLGVTTNHGKRVAALCVLLGRRCALVQEQLEALAACAIMHDCALTEYVQEEYKGSFLDAAGTIGREPGGHCAMGERYLRALPFGPQTAGAVLYHHENADGTGPFGKTAAETPLYAQLIHIADTADTMLDLSCMNAHKRAVLADWLKAGEGTLFERELAENFREMSEYFDWSLLDSGTISAYQRSLLPRADMTCTPEQLIRFASVFAAITDYKSHFTRTHSAGVAQKAKQLGEYYEVGSEMAAKLYFAGALHDIGKLAVDRGVLEKPARLTDSEYRHIQDHAVWTYKILSGIQGLEDVTHWASNHHEKLDGSGYPQGLAAGQLDFWDRMLGCIDIYQALTEERPYKAGMTHAQAAAILRRMAGAGKLDESIVEDLCTQLAPCV